MLDQRVQWRLMSGRSLMKIASTFGSGAVVNERPVLCLADRIAQELIGVKVDALENSGIILTAELSLLPPEALSFSVQHPTRD